MIRIWTERDRAALIEASRPGQRECADAVGFVDGMVRSWADLLPSHHRGVALLPLLVHKVAGYNALAQMWAERALASARAGSRVLRGGRLIASALRGMYPEEFFAFESLRRQGGRVCWLRGCASAESLMRRYHPPRLEQPGYQPHEVELPIAARAPRAPARADVLLVGTMPNYLNPMSPVAAELRRRGYRTAALLPRESSSWAGHGAKWADTPAIEDLFDAEAARVRDGFGAECAEAWDSRREEFARRCRVDGVSLWPFIERDVEWVVKRHLPAAAACVEVGHRSVSEGGVRAVLCARLRRVIDSALVAGCRAGGARAAMIIHGHIGSSPEREFGDGGFDGVDRVLVWGDHQRQIVLRKRFAPADPASVVPVGNPDWDRLAEDPSERAAARAALAPGLGLNPDRRWLLFCTQPQTAQQARVMISACEGLANAEVLIKVHPAEDAGLYRRMASRSGAAVIAHGEAPLRQVLRAVDAGVMFSSTTNIEAMLLGTPVITLAGDSVAGLDRLVRLEEFGLPIATDVAGLRSLLQTVAEDPEAFRDRWRPGMNAVLESVVSRVAGRGAGERAADEVVGLMSAASRVETVRGELAAA